jgi:lipoprotein-releasing system permease protein
MYDYDMTRASRALGDAQEFFDLKDEVSALEVRVRDVYAARTIARRIEQALGSFPYRARDWTEANRDLFSALQLR